MDHRGKGMAVAFVDYDRDEYPDILVTNDSMRNFLFHNRKNGSFEEVGVEAGVAYGPDSNALSNMGAAVGDFDNDGFFDVAITALNGETFPLYRNTSGRFEDVTHTGGSDSLQRNERVGA